jgi:hypothetical protein
MQQIQKERPVPQARIPKALHLARLPAPFDRRIRPGDHIRVRRCFSAFSDGHDGLRDVVPHHLPDEAEGDNFVAVRDVCEQNNGSY